MKRGAQVLTIILFIAFTLPFIAAQEESENDIITNIDEQYADAELADPGISPDSPFYFVDEFFDQFADDVKVREERVAEIRAMVQAGDIEAAREALEKYEAAANELEREVAPEEREAAQRSAAAIRRAIKEIEDQIPESEREAFVTDILEQEAAIVTAAEIASKIETLCKELSEIDPLEYSRVCKTDEDSPQWQRDLHEDLTEEQQEEAEKFFRIMSQCFNDIEDCQCGEISVQAFANKCEEVIPLAIECENGNEDACDEVDEKTEGIEELLPEYLQRVLKELENFEDERFEDHAPEECIEAGATSHEECEQVMFRIHAPEECVDALDREEFEFKDQREAHEYCEEILFEVHAPPECLEAGIDNHEDCGTFIFKEYAPEECIEAGLTGEHPRDNEKCDEIMENLQFDEHSDFSTPGVHCQDIGDADERLKCYDAALAGEFYEPRHDDQYKDEYYDEEYDEDYREEEYYDEEYEEGEYGEEYYESPPEDDEYEEDYEDDRDDEQDHDSEENEEQEESHEDNEQDSRDDGEEQGGSDGGGGITGGVIGINYDNPFLRYFFNRF